LERPERKLDLEGIILDEQDVSDEGSGAAGQRGSVG
jgi:hypothetical protein